MLDRLLCGDGERRGRSCHFPTFHTGKRMNIFNQTVHRNNNKESHFIDLSSRFRALWTFTLCVTFVDIHEEKFNRQTHFVFIIKSSIIMVEVVFSNVTYLFHLNILCFHVVPKLTYNCDIYKYCQCSCFTKSWWNILFKLTRQLPEMR